MNTHICLVTVSYLQEYGEDVRFAALQLACVVVYKFPKHDERVFNAIFILCQNISEPMRF
jgi:hypothetical protein